MPLYNYECEECQIQLEVKHMMSEDPDVKCKFCGRNMYRIVSGGTGMIITENCDSISAKPDSYFANAERKRLSDLKKRKEQTMEKLQYKDKAVETKLENRLINAERAGKDSLARGTELLIKEKADVAVPRNKT